MGGIAWTEEEDNLLKKCIQQYGEGKWHRVPLLAGIFSLYIIFMFLDLSPSTLVYWFCFKTLLLTFLMNKSFH